MKVRKGDKVKVTTGKHKGTIGLVLGVNPKKNSVMVEGVNVKKKALDKQPGVDTTGMENFVYIQHAINASNVRLVDEKGGYLKKRVAYQKAVAEKVEKKATKSVKAKKSETTKKTKGKSK